MADRILVTFASRAGSTAGPAEAIGKTLAEGGAQVDVLPMQDVKDLAPYRAAMGEGLFARAPDIGKVRRTTFCR